MKPFEFAADPGPVLALSRHAREREGLPLVPMKRVLATLGVLGGMGLAALFEAV
jgi:hypothetical protein